MLEDIFWIARTRQLELGIRQLRRRTASGLWEVMLEALADDGGDADLLQMIDRTGIQEAASQGACEDRWD